MLILSPHPDHRVAQYAWRHPANLRLVLDLLPETRQYLRKTSTRLVTLWKQTRNTCDLLPGVPCRIPFRREDLPEELHNLLQVPGLRFLFPAEYCFPVLNPTGELTGYFSDWHTDNFGLLEVPGLCARYTFPHAVLDDHRPPWKGWQIERWDSRVPSEEAPTEPTTAEERQRTWQPGQPLTPAHHRDRAWLQSRPADSLRGWERDYLRRLTEETTPNG